LGFTFFDAKFTIQLANALQCFPDIDAVILLELPIACVLSSLRQEII